MCSFEPRKMQMQAARIRLNAGSGADKGYTAFYTQTVPLELNGGSGAEPRRGLISVTPRANVGAVVLGAYKSASKMPHNCGKAAVLLRIENIQVRTSPWRLMCGIFEADVSCCIYTPCSAVAAHGVTEVRPLRGQKAGNLSVTVDAWLAECGLFGGKTGE